MAPALRSIGQVLAVLKTDFPDVSISKIRFLESEGLVAPDRAPSGYRRYSDHDVERLRYILAVQRDHYLPLKVIREHLDMMDRGLEPPSVSGPAPAPAGATRAPETPPAGTGVGGVGPAEGGTGEAERRSRRPLRLSRDELMEASGLSEPALIELERQLIVVPRRGTNHYGRDAVTLAIAARKLAEYGIDARHMRTFKMAAEREVGMVEQAVAPIVRRQGGDRRVAMEATNLVLHAHAALVRIALERGN